MSQLEACVFQKNWTKTQLKNIRIEFLLGKDTVKTTPQNLLALVSAKTTFSLTLWPNFHNMMRPLFLGPLFVGPLSAYFSNN